MLPEYITDMHLIKFFQKEKTMVFSVAFIEKHSQRINLEKLTEK